MNRRDNDNKNHLRNNAHTISNGEYSNLINIVGKYRLSRQAIIIISVTIIFIVIGVYSYSQLYERLQLNNSKISTKLNQMRLDLQSEHKNLISTNENFTDRKTNEQQFLRLSISIINEKYDDMYQQIQKIMYMAKQDEQNKQSSQNHLKLLINQTKKIEQLQKEVTLFYQSSKNFQILLQQQNNDTVVEQQGQVISQKVLWLFLSSNSNNKTYLNQLYYKNIKYFTEQSGYDLKVVTINNYYYYLSSQKIGILYDIFAVLKKIIEKQKDQTNLKEHFQHIAQILIMMHILQENGGIIINQYVALLSPLDWIQNIINYDFVNKGNGNTDAKVIAFFNPQKSSIKKLQNKNGVSEDEMLMYKFPSIDEIFLFAVKESQFITEINKQMIQILKHDKDFEKEIKQQKYQIIQINPKTLYQEFFVISNQIVLQKKQRQLDTIKDNDVNIYTAKFALDYYGLYTINRYYGPYKLSIHFEGKKQSLAFNYLSKYSLQQLQQKIGNIQFASRIQPFEYFEAKLTQIKQKNSTQIMRGSFIQQVFYPYNHSENIQFSQNQIMTLDQSNQNIRKWDQLPKKIWVYRSKNINDQNRIVESKCLGIIRQRAQEIGFGVNLVTEKMLGSYLSKQTIQAINQIWYSSPYKDQKLRQIVFMLTILSQQGGIFMDSSYVVLEKLDWLIDIASTSPQYINNRLGEIPYVFMFTNPNFQQNFHWKFDKEAKTRIKPDLVYDLSFIAATKQNRIIDEWLGDLTRLLQMNFQSTQQYFHSCEILDPVYKNNKQDLLAVDILRCVMKRGTRNVQKLNIAFNGEYNLWSIDGDFSLSKFNQATNYQNIHKSQNQFLVRYSKEYAQQIVGMIGKIIKLNARNLNYLNDKIKNYNSQKDQINSQSIFSQYLLQ